ncbi:MAG TPA: hypothetical protein VNR18_07305 [Hyphomicrobiales bacterium]|nr:hypothetical protein [Hyphomicrobiales bacterium]
MKRLVLASLFLGLATTATAGQVRLVNADASALSEICIAAVESRAAARATASELGVPNRDLAQLQCNDMPLAEFVRRYRAPTPTLHLQTAYVFKGSDASPLTALCMASLENDTAFATARARLDDDLDLSEVRCNKLPLDEFVRKYRQAELTAFIGR